MGTTRTIPPGGFVFTLDTDLALAFCMENGVYGARLGSQPDRGYWHRTRIAILADFGAMEAGDNVYFFRDRFIYGIGKMVRVGGDYRFDNFPGASQPSIFGYDEIRDGILVDSGPDSPRMRWLCTFQPAPYFFTEGVDMDDALASRPEAFRMLRAMEGRSFVKLDHEENQALKNVLLRVNQDALREPVIEENVYRDGSRDAHSRIARLSQLADYHLDIGNVVATLPERSGGALSQEYGLEASLLEQLRSREARTTGVFGPWDYLSRQVIASPFKPIKYADAMDIFGYRFIDGHEPSVADFLIIENKKGCAREPDVLQLMKYVDWVRDEYAQNDYSSIKAFLVAHSFADGLLEYVEAVAKRYYTVFRRTPKSAVWNDLQLVRYRYDSGTTKVGFEIVAADRPRDD